MKNTKLITRIICIVLAIIMALALLISVIPTVANADELSDLQQKKEEASSRVYSANNKLAKLREEKNAVVEEKLALEERNEAAKEQIELIKQEIELYNKKIEEKRKEVEAAQQEENIQFSRYKTRIRAMEEAGGYNILSLILNSDSFSGLLASLDDYGDVMNSDKTLYIQLQDARKNLEEIKAEFESYREECQKKQAELEEEQRKLEEQIAEAEAEIEELNEKIKEAEEEQKAAEAALAAASANVSSFLSNYEAAKKAVQSGTVTQSESSIANYDYSVTGNGSYAWPFPASHRVSSTMKTRWGRSHTGVDIDGFNLAGSPIVAADGGTVILAGVNGGYGNCVIIDHNNGSYTLYGHMSFLSVSTGQAVSQGQTVGGCGMTGSATGLHLHFEVRQGGNSSGNCIDPLQFFGGYELEPGAADVS